MTVQDIYSACGQSPMRTAFEGPACLGADIGKNIHVVVGFRSKEKIFEVCYLARVSSFADLHDICARFHVKCAVLDLEPEVRQVRSWQASESFPVWGCDYINSVLSGPQWDDGQKVLKVHRTESLDNARHTIDSGLVVFPRKSEDLEEFAKELTSLAKVLEVNEETGGREFKYRRLGGPDHYYHAFSYALLAASRIAVYESSNDPERRLLEILRKRQDQAYDPLSWSLQDLQGSSQDTWSPLSYGLDGLKK